jgi:CRISPR-associated protein Cas6
MLWQEEHSPEEVISAPTVVDLVFNIDCRRLPVDHAYALSQAIEQVLPWFAEEVDAGLHLIHGADSGNGWQRPELQDDLLLLSRRTKLILRLPRHRLVDAQILISKTLDIAGYPLTVEKAVERLLTPTPVLFSRHIIASSTQAEEVFLETIVAELRQLGIQCRKALCGKTFRFKLPNGELFTRSLMVADLALPESLILQRRGLGKGKKMGCGLFIPHKDIKAVNSDSGSSRSAMV